MQNKRDTFYEYALDTLKNYFNNDNNRLKVFYSRQLELIFEDTYFHWITNRAVNSLIEVGFLNSDERKLESSGNIHLVWHKSNRNYKKSAKEVFNLVEQYSDPAISYELGSHLERLILEGFASNKFLLEGRDINEFNNIKWSSSNHNLDFIFSKDNIIYGVEVKNMLGYMDYEEFKIKIDICFTLGLIPIFVCRMLPKSWIREINDLGGFCLILKFQIYPPFFKSLVNELKNKLLLPVDCPRKIEDGTMQRVLKWHNQNVKKLINQQ